MRPDARTRMRDVLKTAVSRARLPGAELTHPGRFEPDRSAHDWDALERRFRDELTKLGGTVHEASSAADVASTIRTLALAAGSPKVVAWDEASLPIAGLTAAMRAEGLTVLVQSPDTAQSAEHLRKLAAAAVGVTGADAGLAETGSIVVASGPGRGRLASLLPPIHVVLLRRDLLVQSLPVLVADRPDLVTSGANFVCITGPSRTADIGHVLARGVHGPREIHVVLTPS
jgi:L-lactate dehydrogenase complex protein LldG